MAKPRKRETDDAPTTSSRAWLVGAIAAGSVLACCVCSGLGFGVWFLRGGGEQGGGLEVVKGAKPKPDFSMTDHEFHAEFLSKRKADGRADEQFRAKYAGKVIELTGTIQRAGSERIIFLGQGLKQEFAGSYIGCELMPDSQKQSLELVTGQKVRVRGQFSSGMFGAVTLVDCSFEALEQMAMPRISVDKIAADFDADSSAAKKKYDGMDMIITGTVEKVGVDRINNELWQMKAAGARTRVFVMPGIPLRGKIRPGRQVEFLPRFDFKNGLPPASFNNRELHIPLRTLISPK